MVSGSETRLLVLLSALICAGILWRELTFASQRDSRTFQQHGREDEEEWSLGVDVFSSKQYGYEPVADEKGDEDEDDEDDEDDEAVVSRTRSISAQAAAKRLRTAVRDQKREGNDNNGADRRFARVHINDSAGHGGEMHRRAPRPQSQSGGGWPPVCRSLTKSRVECIAAAGKTQKRKKPHDHDGVAAWQTTARNHKGALARISGVKFVPTSKNCTVVRFFRRSLMGMERAEASPTAYRGRGPCQYRVSVAGGELAVPDNYLVSISISTTSVPFLHVTSKDHTDMMDEWIRQYGIWDAHIMGILHYIGHDECKSFRNLVVDVGANNGCFALFAAALGCRVLAFEPQPDVALNVALSSFVNGFQDRLVLFNALVSNTATSMKVLRPKGSNTALATVVAPDTPCPRDAQLCALVPAVVLSDLVDEDAIALKIDVEGFEAKVLKGAEVWLAKRRVSDVIFEFGPNKLEPVAKKFHTLNSLQILELMDDLKFEGRAVGFVDGSSKSTDARKHYGNRSVTGPPPNWMSSLVSGKIDPSRFAALVRDDLANTRNCVLWRGFPAGEHDMWFSRASDGTSC